MDENVVHVQILGTSFDLRSDEDPVYMNQLITYLKRKVEETGRLTGGRDHLRTALIAGLLITDELFKNRRRTDAHAGEQTEDAEMSVITKRMLERLDRSLSS